MRPVRNSEHPPSYFYKTTFTSLKKITNMQTLNNAQEMNLQPLNEIELLEIEGGVMPDKDGRGCTEHGLPVLFQPPFTFPTSL